MQPDVSFVGRTAQLVPNQENSVLQYLSCNMLKSGRPCGLQAEQHAEDLGAQLLGAAQQVGELGAELTDAQSALATGVSCSEAAAAAIADLTTRLATVMEKEKCLASETMQLRRELAVERSTVETLQKDIEQSAQGAESAAHKLHELRDLQSRDAERAAELLAQVSTLKAEIASSRQAGKEFQAQLASASESAVSIKAGFEEQLEAVTGELATMQTQAHALQAQLQLAHQAQADADARHVAAASSAKAVQTSLHDQIRTTAEELALTQARLAASTEAAAWEAGHNRDAQAERNAVQSHSENLQRRLDVAQDAGNEAEQRAAALALECAELTSERNRLKVQVMELQLKYDSAAACAGDANARALSAEADLQHARSAAQSCTENHEAQLADLKAGLLRAISLPAHFTVGG